MMRLLLIPLLMVVTICLSSTVSAGKKTATNREKVIGTWKASLTINKDSIEFGVFTFRDDGKFTVEREHFLDLVKGTYTVESDAFKMEVTDAVDGAPMEKGEWPVKTRSISDKEIVFELNHDGRSIPIHLARIPVSQAAWQAIEQDRKRLQGTWEYVGTEKEGKLIKDEKASKSMTFQGEKVLEPGAKEYGIFTLSANRKLKAIQFRYSDGKGLANLFAYELEGDMLRICRDPARSFPEKFTTEGTKGEIVEFRRADRSAQGKKVSEQFAKTLFLDLDLKSVVKLVAVPFFWPYDQGKVVDKLDVLKEDIERELIRGNEAQKGSIKLHKAQTYEQYLAEDPGSKQFFDKVMRKGDRIIGVSVMEQGSVDKLCLLVMVAWPDGQPKVVGFLVVPPSVLEPKKKN